MAKLDLARTEALKALIKYQGTEQIADLAVSDMDNSLTNERDRRFARQLVLGSIRWRMRLDWIIDKFSRQPRSRNTTYAHSFNCCSEARYILSVSVYSCLRF